MNPVATATPAVRRQQGPRRAAPGATPEPIPDVGQMLAEATRLSIGLNRPDLAQRLTQSRARLESPDIRVAVVGEFKQGKSKLINALVNAPVCPIDDDVATSVSTAVTYGERAAAFILRPSPDQGGSAVLREEIPLDRLADYVSESGNPGNVRALVGAEVQLPREILKGGLRLVDSPGVGSIDSRSALMTMSTLASAHAVLLVSDASQEYTDPEMQLLRHAMRVSPNVAAVLAKTDLYPQWRDIERIDRHHLESIGGPPLFSVSSDLRLLAAVEQDRDMNAESGFPGLVAHLRADILQRAEIIAARGVAHDVAFVLEQLDVSMRAELRALQHPEETPALIVALEEAKAKAEDFKSRSSKWNVALSDGIADLSSDLEHDLRDRLRRVQREAEQAIDEGDPGPIWEQIAEWTDQRIADAISETFVWTDERSNWLLEEIAGIFADEQGELPSLAVGGTEGLLDPVDPLPDFSPGHLGAVEKLYIGVRGSYGGVLMVGLATGLIGLSLINPISLLVGVLVGRRAYREDMNARLTRRRFEAKNIVRRYIDEVTFQVSKQLKDRLRVVQRTARDHFGSIAEETHRSLALAVLAAKQSAGSYSTDRDKRIQALQVRLREVENVARRVPAMSPGTPVQAISR